MVEPRKMVNQMSIRNSKTFIKCDGCKTEIKTSPISLPNLWGTLRYKHLGHWLNKRKLLKIRHFCPDCLKKIAELFKGE